MIGAFGGGEGDGGYFGVAHEGFDVADDLWGVHIPDGEGEAGGELGGACFELVGEVIKGQCAGSGVVEGCKNGEG